MRIVLRVLTMIVGVLLLLGMFALAFWSQVLAVAPTKTPPPTAEDMAEFRASTSLPFTPTVVAEDEPTTMSPNPPEPL